MEILVVLWSFNKHKTIDYLLVHDENRVRVEIPVYTYLLLLRNSHSFKLKLNLTLTVSKGSLNVKSSTDNASFAFHHYWKSIPFLLLRKQSTEGTVLVKCYLVNCKLLYFCIIYTIVTSFVILLTGIQSRQLFIRML